MPDITFCIPCYQAPTALAQLVAEWSSYPKDGSVKIIVVDDGSPEPVQKRLFEGLGDLVTLLRIEPNITWNQAGARNLGGLYASTPWLLFHDVDHVLDAENLARLRASKLRPDTLYLFKRQGSKPSPSKGHLLVRRELFWQLGAFNEDFAGHYGYEDTELFMRDKNVPQTIVEGVRLRILEGLKTPHLSRDLARNGEVLEHLKRPTSYIRFLWHVVV